MAWSRRPLRKEPRQVEWRTGPPSWRSLTMVLAIRASIAHLAGEYKAAELRRCVPSLWIRLALRGGIDWAGFMRRPIGLMTPMPFFAELNAPSAYLDGAASLDGVGTAYFLPAVTRRRQWSYGAA